MCGIFGFVDQTKKLTLDHLKTSTDMVKYRGMDDKGYVLKSYGKHNVGFGHRRLSIIDLSSEGHQPWEFENLISTYNGEIYNFME
jgi:asparagine synthase (glutamine-hydrolysing)